MTTQTAPLTKAMEKDTYMITDETFCHLRHPYGAIECRVNVGPNLGALLGVEKGGRFYEVFTNAEGDDKLKRVSESYYRNQFPLK